MSFLQKHVGGSGFGADLRELREQRGVSLEELSRLTRIHSSILIALEEESLGELRDPRYEERHVRTIVLALEGHPAYFVKKYQELLDRRGIPATEGLPSAVKKLRRRDFFVTSRAVAIVGFLFFVGLAAGYLIWQGHQLQNAPMLVVDAPAEGLQLTTPHVSISGETDAAASVLVNGRPAVVNRNGHFSLLFDVPRGLTTITIEARRRFGSSVIETRRVTYTVEGGELLNPGDSFPPEKVNSTNTESVMNGTTTTKRKTP